MLLCKCKMNLCLRLYLIYKLMGEIDYNQVQVLLLFLSVAKSCLTFIPWTVTNQTHLSMGFPRQEYWSTFPFPSTGDLPDPGIEPTSMISQLVKNPPAMQEIPIGFLGQEDTLEKG